MTCGIYLLYWSIEYPYIGQSININLRKTRHFSEIKSTTHCNSKILAEFNKYASMPLFEILEECSSKELNALEEFYIKEFNSIDKGMNITSGGDSVGVGTNNPRSKYSEEQLSTVFELLIDPNNGFQDISRSTGVNRSTVNQIANGHQHIWLQEKFPEIFQKIKASQSIRSSLVQTIEHKGNNYPLVVSPEGTIVKINTSLDTFCISNKLQNTNMYKLFKGKIQQHKGWKLHIN